MAPEAETFTPGLSVATITQTARKSGVSLRDAIAGAHVVVTSYALFRIDAENYGELDWSALVLDEAQFVKNHQSRTYQVARTLQAPVKIAITGTPLENSLMDLWALLSITAPGLFPSPQRFGELFRKPIESGTSPELLATLRRRIRPLMLRRTKEAVAQDLPPKIEQVVTVPLNTAHRRIYDTHLQRERQRILGLLDDVDHNRVAILTALTQLRQLSLDVHLVVPDAPANVALQQGRGSDRATRRGRRRGAPVPRLQPVHPVPGDRPPAARRRRHRARLPRRPHAQPAEADRGVHRR